MEKPMVTQPIILHLKGTLKAALLPAQMNFLNIHKSNNIKDV